MAPSAPEVLTPRDARMAALSAQCLLKSVPSVEEALVRTAGVSGAIPSGALSLAARVSNFSPADLDRALEEDRSVVRVPAMRGAVYLLPTDLAAAGLSLARPGQFRPALDRAGMREEAHEELTMAVEALLEGTQRTGTEIRRALGPERIKRDLPKGTFVFFLRGLSHEGRILRVGVRGGPRSQAFEYARTEDWIGAPLRVPSETEGLARLLPLYLDAHGPAGLQDLAWWAGVTQKVARTAVRRLGPREVRLEGRGDVVYTSDTPLPGDSRVHASRVTLLPHWDPYLTAHVDRSRYLPQRCQDRVVDRGGNSTNVILVDGQVAGVWDYSEGVLAYAGFRPGLNPSLLRAASTGVASVLGELNLIERSHAPSLRGRGQNAFRSPLRGVETGKPGSPP
ncbi:MAG: winged helix DNA-binding domain-containing protein [Thermoplasmata archaeon]